MHFLWAVVSRSIASEGSITSETRRPPRSSLEGHSAVQAISAGQGIHRRKRTRLVLPAHDLHSWWGREGRRRAERTRLPDQRRRQPHPAGGGSKSRATTYKRLRTASVVAPTGPTPGGFHPGQNQTTAVVSRNCGFNGRSTTWAHCPPWLAFPRVFRLRCRGPGCAGRTTAGGTRFCRQ